MVAFARGDERDRILVAVARHLGSKAVADGASPAAGWDDTVLPLPSGWPTRWTCALCGERLDADGGALRVDALFGLLPGALLVPDDHP